MTPPEYAIRPCSGQVLFETRDRLASKASFFVEIDGVDTYEVEYRPSKCEVRVVAAHSDEPRGAGPELKLLGHVCGMLIYSGITEVRDL